MSTLEDTVRSVVKDFITNDVLFTALDVSNTVKKGFPLARHREVRDVVRNMFVSDIETQGWARTPINVTLGDGTKADALLYHPLTDSWDLDNKYNVQQRQITSARVVVPQASPISVTVISPNSPLASALTTPITVGVAAPSAPMPMPTARALWDQLFQTQPSLFPSK